MNWDLIGNEWAVNLLASHVALNKPRHAYLFTGMPGVGRRTLALRLAQALNCPQPPQPGVPCLNCLSCNQFGRMQHPDLAVVEAEQRGATLKVEQVRELQHSLWLAPFDARYRIALLLRFEEANSNAANALLKTLEEPPDKVILILTAESSEALPPTIVSRCEMLHLHPLPIDELTQSLLARYDLPEEQASRLAHISSGRPGLAIKYLQQPEQLEKRQHRLDDHIHLLSASYVERFDYAESLYKDKESILATLEVWLSFWHDVLLQTIGLSAPPVNLDHSAEISQLATGLGLSEVRRTLTNITHTLDLLDRNINPRLALEVLMLDLPHR
jgi:DNA polymerase-3 subunit delta'